MVGLVLAFQRKKQDCLHKFRGSTRASGSFRLSFVNPKPKQSRKPFIVRRVHQETMKTRSKNKENVRSAGKREWPSRHSFLFWSWLVERLGDFSGSNTQRNKAKLRRPRIIFHIQVKIALIDVMCEVHGKFNWIIQAHKLMCFFKVVPFFNKYVYVLNLGED